MWGGLLDGEVFPSGWVLDPEGEINRKTRMKDWSMAIRRRRVENIY